MNKLCIGTTGGYPIERLIDRNFDWEDVNDIHWKDSPKNIVIRGMGYASKYIRKSVSFKEREFTFYNNHLKNIDVVHSFNIICDTNVPWGVSFECTLPAYVGNKENEQRNYTHER